MARGLGKGLEGLFEDNLRTEEEEQGAGILKIVRISSVEPNRSQPRKTFEKEKIDELAQSIRENGVLQPLIVRENGRNRYQIISGERRWRASKLAGLEEVPVIVRDLDEQKVLEVALIENLQREDLNAVEEARGYKNLMENFGLTQEQIAERVSKSRPAVANAMRILALPDEILDMVESGELTSGHARALLALADRVKNREELIRTAKTVAEKKLSVRAVEDMVKKPRKLTRKKPAADDAVYYRKISEQLTRAWGRRITVNPGEEKNGKKEGTVVLEYYSMDDLNDLIEKLTDKKEV